MQALFLTNEAINQRRSGPAIRCLELARAVARPQQVAIASLQPCDMELKEIRLLPDALNRRSELEALCKQSDVVVTQGLALARWPALAKLARHLVIDLYDPYLLEYLAHAHPRHPTWGYLRQLHRLNQQMLEGDFFLCANERQRDYWLGRLCALGRLNPDEYQRDVSFEKLIAVVPFGLPADPPRHTRNVMKGVLPGIAQDDFVLLWAGGLWQWLDPLTPIRAMAEVATIRPKAKLVFLGAHDPNPNNRPMSVAEEARRLAEELKLLGRNVFFHEQWVPYEERENFLLEADVGISAHPATIESRFAFRTRVLDYIWAGLPMILTSGDDFSDWAERNHVGRVVAPGDVTGWKEAIVSSVIYQDTGGKMARIKLRGLAPNFQWQRVAEPLARYCAAPYKTHRASMLRKKLVPLLSSGYEIAKGWRG
jgi:glycosyltransferase involved in cell wall biosynthesis